MPRIRGSCDVRLHMYKSTCTPPKAKHSCFASVCIDKPHVVQHLCQCWCMTVCLATAHHFRSCQRRFLMNSSVRCSTDSDVKAAVAPLGRYAAPRFWATAERRLARDTSAIVSVLMAPAVSVTVMLVSLLRSASDATFASSHVQNEHGRGSALDRPVYDPRGAHPEAG